MVTGGSDHADAVHSSSQRRRALLSLVVLLAIVVQLLAPMLAPPPAYAAPAQPAAVIAGAPPAATLGEAYSYRFTLRDAPHNVVTVASGSLPLGLELSPDGLLSGTPLNGGEYNFTLWVGNAFGVAATLPVQLEVVARAAMSDSVAAPDSSAPRPVYRQPNGGATIAYGPPAAPATSVAASPQVWTALLANVSAFFVAVGSGLNTFVGFIGELAGTAFTSVASGTAAFVGYLGTMFGVTPNSLPQGPTPSFGEPLILEAPASVERVVVADVDRDSHPDLIASHPDAPYLSVWRGDPTSALGFTQPITTSLSFFGDSVWPGELVVADFNGNGLPDLAMAAGNGGILVWLNNSTPGQIAFSMPLTLSTGLPNTYFLAAGDFDGDGRADLAATPIDSIVQSVAVLLNRTGTNEAPLFFGPPVLVELDGLPAGISAADLNGNGRADLAVSTWNDAAGSQLSVLLSTEPLSNTARFGSLQNFGLDPAWFGWGVKASDLNGDGTPDLVVNLLGSDGVGTAASVIFLNATGAGATEASFAAGTPVGRGGEGTTNLDLADFNADDRADIALRNWLHLDVLANSTASGATTPTFQAPLDLMPVPSESNFLTAADVDGDGKPDLAIPNGNTIILRINATQSSPPPTPTPTNTPTPGPSGTRDVGAIRIWANNFAESGGITTATGTVGIGSQNANAPFYTISTSASWQGSGPINLVGSLGLSGGPLLGNGPFSVDRTTGAISWGSGSQITLGKLGDSNLGLSGVTITVNALQAAASVSATVALGTLPENTGRTLAVSYTLGQGGAINGPAASLNLTLAGGTLAASVIPGKTGLSAAIGQYTLPGLTALTLQNLLIDGQGTTGLRIGTGSTFALPNINLGANVFLLNNLQGTLAVSGSAYIINLTGGITISGLPELPAPISPPVQNLRIAAGAVTGDIGNFAHKVGGNTIAFQSITINRLAGSYRLTAATATFTWPAAWGTATTNLTSVSLLTTSPYITFGGGTQSFSAPGGFRLGGATARVNVLFDQINATISYNPQGNRWGVSATLRITFTLGSDVTVAEGVTMTVSDGVASGSINNLAMKLAGLNLNLSQLAYSGGTFSAGSATLSLPTVWNGTSVSVSGVTISSSEFRIGGAGGTFAIPDQTLGKSVRLSGMSGTVNFNLNTGAYTISVTAGSVVFTAGTSSASASNVVFTIASGSPSAAISSLTLQVAGLTVIASQITYGGGIFTAGSATLRLPAALQNTTVAVSGLRITNDQISIGGAGATFTIPNISLGSSNVLSITNNRGSLSVDTNGNYEFSISSTVAIAKVQTTGGGSGLTVAGTLRIRNGSVSGSISTLAFKVSGVDFLAENMQFVGDKLTVQQASLSLTIAGKRTSATIYGLELGGSVGFRFQGAQVTLPDFTIGTVGVRGAMLSFIAGADGSYTVEGRATFAFTQFSVAGAFKIAIASGGGVSLRSVSLTFNGSIPSPSIPLGNTGFAIVRLSGSFDLSDGSTTISMGLGAASVAGVAGISVLQVDATVTITIKPSFSLRATAGAKLIGIQVASVDLFVSPTAFRLNGRVQVAIVQASVEIAFGRDASGQFTFYGAVRAAVVVPRGYVCNGDWWCFGKRIPGSNTNIGTASLEGGKFQRGGSIIWGARGSAKAFGITINVWARFAPGGTAFGLGNNLNSYTPVRPVGMSTEAFAAAVDPYRITVGAPAEYLIVVESISDANLGQPEAIQISGPPTTQFTRTLVHTELDESDPLTPVAVARLYRLDFANPADAVGQWTVDVRSGNLVAILGATPPPQLDTFSGCADGVCFQPGTTRALSNGQTVNVNWAASATEPGMALEIYAESAPGTRYPIARQETMDGRALTGSTQWTLGLPSGTYTVTTQLEGDGFGPVQEVQGVFIINDTTPPAAPVGLQATAHGLAATATWDGNAAEPDVMGYRFIVNGGDPIELDGRLDAYITHGLEPGAAHTISVAAYDMSGNYGPAATVTVNTPSFGVASEWPLRNTLNTGVREVGASLNGPITLGGLTVTGENGVVQGSVTPLTADEGEGGIVVLGAIFVPDGGALPPGRYTAQLTATNPATNTAVSHQWTFEVGKPIMWQVVLPLVTR